MLLSITNETAPATDLGYLLHKNPSRSHSVELAFGNVHVFFPEATDSRCTACLLLDVDPIKLVRREGQDRSDAHYVNDRPYVASSFMSTAISKTFGTAMGGRCKAKPELVDQPLALTATIPVLPCHGGEALLRRLFEPLGYNIDATGGLLDERFPDWGSSPYFSVTLTKKTTVAELLSHLHVLIPVLDDEKHYWVAEGEVENLMRRGEGWLASHPERDLILRRALKNQRDLIGPALERLAAIEDAPAAAMVEDRDEAEAGLEKQIGLNERRMNQVHATLKEIGAKRVVDLGCGEGKLLQLLLKDTQFTQIAGMDVAPSVLKRAARRLNLADLPRLVRERLTLFQGSLVYRDMRVANYDAATLVEVIEHLDSDRLASLERVVFGFARPAMVIVTTPNVEYNVRFPRLPAGKFRHADHRFEWTRTEFKDWASRVGEKYGYSWEHRPVGEDDPLVGPPTQMALFRLTQPGGTP